jgi:succinyl-CoA synthetase beta subunit
MADAVCDLEDCVSAMELNPLMVLGQGEGVLAVDAKIHSR